MKAFDLPSFTVKQRSSSTEAGDGAIFITYPKYMDSRQDAVRQITEWGSGKLRQRLLPNCLSAFESDLVQGSSSTR